MKKYVLFSFIILFSCQWEPKSRTLNNTELDCSAITQKTFQNYEEAKEFINNMNFVFQEKIATAKSSWIRSIAYYSCDQQYGYLEIVTDKGNYLHQNVPMALWEAFKQAESYGKFYNRFIKHRYPLQMQTK